VMLAHLLGDGCFVFRQPIHYASADPANLEAVEQAASHFGTTPRRVAQSARLARVASVLEDDRLARVASSDVFWDSIEAIEPLGDQPVYDATVLGTHNFIADGIVAHNSLEQDADVVLFIYRDELYDKETERKGEADLILAKHRNGPTDTVVVTFQGQYSRFFPMAPRSM